MTTTPKPATLLCTALLLATYAFQAEAKPLKVFILAGQSNMDGQADVRTIDFLGEDKDAACAALLQTFKPDGKTFVTRDDVWVASGSIYSNLQTGFGGRRDYSKLGTCIGPEYAFGYYMGEALDEQVLLIKYGPGGTSLLSSWRPPSAGPTGDPTADAAELDQATVDKWFGGHGGKVIGCQYRVLVRYVHETLADLKKHFPTYNEIDGYEIAGFVWFQGYNDLGCTKEQYSSALVALIKDLRTEFKAPAMKAVIGVMGVNGVKNEGGKQEGVRGGQRFINTVPEFEGNARAIETAPLLSKEVVDLMTMGWLNKDRDEKTNPVSPEERAMLGRATSNKGFHYFGEGRFFVLLGKAFADTMLELSGKGNKVLPPKLNDFQPPAVTSK